MSIQDVLIEAEAEKAQAQKVAEYRGSHVRLPDELWGRLDRVAEELGWSRNRLMVELLDHGSMELAVLMSRDSDGQTDLDRLCRLVDLEDVGGEAEAATGSA